MSRYINVLRHHHQNGATPRSLELAEGLVYLPWHMIMCFLWPCLRNLKDCQQEQGMRMVRFCFWVCCSFPLENVVFQKESGKLSS